jgi:tRNA nucleotidyltransferase/poly(A) polymerase
MSDYMFMLENHLSAGQARALAQVRESAEQANLNIFLTGGAMRDMMGGFPIRDLDFTVEGPSVKFAKSLAQSTNARVISVDETRKHVELLFPGNVQVSVSMARQERYPKPAAKPQIQPATIHEDLRGRDFTVNAIALSVGKASRGLLLDPTNGLGDLSRKELRTVSNYTLYDDPVRLLRLMRLKVRLGFQIEERTLSQYRNVRESGLETKITPQALSHELKEIAADPLAGEILKVLEAEQLLHIFSAALAGPKLNLPAFQRLHKAQQIVPFGMGIETASFALFLFFLFEKLSPKEKSQLIQNAAVPKEQVDAATKLEARAKKVEKEVAAAKITKPSALYKLLHDVPGEVLVFVLARSTQRIVLDRLKNYLQKYLPLAQEVTDKDVVAQGVQTGTPKFEKLRMQMITAKLDARPKKVVVEEPPAPPPPLPGRRSASFGR